MIPLTVLALLGLAPALASPPPEGAWWAAMQDPTLDALLEEGLAASPDAAAAWARVTKAEAVAGQARAGLLPTISLDGSATLAPTDSLGFGLGFGGLAGDADTYTSGSAAINASLGVDLWTRTWRGWRALHQEAVATVGDRDEALLALSALIAGASYDLRAAQASRAVVERQVQTSRDLLSLTELRYEGGDVTGLDLLQQRAQLAAAEAALPTAALSVTLAAQQLAVLIGRPPGAALPELPASLPELPPLDPPPAAEALLAARPDLRAAAARVEAARLSHQSQTLGLLPTLAVAGSYGTQFFGTDELDFQRVWSVGAKASVPIFNGGAKWAAVKEAAAVERTARLSLDSALLSAQAEVQGAAAQEAALAAALAAKRNQKVASDQAFQEARSRYQGGLASYLELLTALNAAWQADLGVISAQRDLLDARLGLHQALGGRWMSQLDAPDRGLGSEEAP